MITITVKDNQVKELLATMPKTASRAVELALDKTAQLIKSDVRLEMIRVFDSPTRYTLNSVRITPTKNHNMVASVWYEHPERMSDHYLTPQIEGGARKLKGFEHALGNEEYIPGRGAEMTVYGNVSVGQIKQIMSVLGKAETSAGFAANMTTRSAKRNTKDRDYVWLPNGSRNGALPPGIYRRVATAGSVAGRYSTISDRTTHKKPGFGAWQTGSSRAVVRAQGLLPILIKGDTGHAVTPLLDFYGVAQRTYDAKFLLLFNARLNELLSK